MSGGPHLERVQRIAAEVLGAIKRPILVNGFAYVRFACCDAPAHARAWAVEEAKGAGKMWEAMAAGRAIAPGWLTTPTRQFACPVCYRRARHDRTHHRHGACPVCHGETLVAPPTCEGVVAMASAAANVTVAERCARELA